MVSEWGMSSRVGPMAWGSSGEVFLGEDLIHTRNYSDETARVIDEEVERILRDQEDRCRMTLREHRNGLDLVARALLEHETIDGSEVTRLINLARSGAEPVDAVPDASGNGDEHARAAERTGPGIDIGPGQGPDAPTSAPPSDALAGSRRPQPRPPAPPT
jgi:hypothetical protein